MSKMSKAVAVLGVVAGLGVAALPLSSYAATTQKVNLEAVIDSTISLSASENNLHIDVVNGANIDKTATDGTKGYATTDLTVTANGGGYTITAKSAADNTNLVSGANNIPYGAPAQGDSFWGMTIDDAATWIANLAASSATTPTTITSVDDINDGGANAKATTTVGFGVTASPTQAAGTYEGAVVFTVAAK